MRPIVGYATALTVCLLLYTIEGFTRTVFLQAKTASLYVQTRGLSQFIHSQRRALQRGHGLKPSQLNAERLSNAVESSRLKKELLALAKRTLRGFQASTKDRRRARSLIDQLAALNPTRDPAKSYYATQTQESNAIGSKDGSSSKLVGEASLSGKWTLVYTDAPDITALGTTNPWAKLGRIGQECEPPYIRNVIEWKRPGWATSLPFSGSEESRVLQRVVTKATASPDQPMVVNLDIVGLRINADAPTTLSNFAEAIQSQGLIAGFFQAAPVDLQGPLQAPFGKFEVLYLDEELRAVKTGQGYVAVNLRTGDEWI
jgi:hypothetical protein|uniref:Plastid lipid-associated protein/fibrillin conserved domain-containing protein n=1 Tax=Phaeodactylum tricornutum TaxID=2850 RepID=A0A8J9TF31_PHATR